MRPDLTVHPFQEGLNITYAVLARHGKHFHRSIYSAPTAHQAQMLLDEHRHFGVDLHDTDEWQPLHTARFTGHLNWTPRVQHTDLQPAYSLRIKAERTRFWALRCTHGGFHLQHPTAFPTELEAVNARRDAIRDLDQLGDWDVHGVADQADLHPAFSIDRDEDHAYRIEMIAPSAIYRHPEIFHHRRQAQATLDRLEHLYTAPGEPAIIADPARLIQGLDGESEAWEYDPQARRKSRPFAFFNLGLDRGLWVNGMAVWNADRFRGFSMLKKGAVVQVDATPSSYRDRIQWRVRDLRLIDPNNDLSAFYRRCYGYRWPAIRPRVFQQVA